MAQERQKTAEEKAKRCQAAEESIRNTVAELRAHVDVLQHKAKVADAVDKLKGIDLSALITLNQAVTSGVVALSDTLAQTEQKEGDMTTSETA